MLFKNKEFDLPKFTFEFEEKLEKLEECNKKLISGEIGRTVVLKKCYKFLTELLSEETLLDILTSAKFEEVDMKELELLFFLIKSEYEKPLKEASIKKEKDLLNKMFTGTNISEIIKLSEKMSNKE